jgi:hypothetical protein
MTHVRRFRGRDDDADSIVEGPLFAERLHATHEDLDRSAEEVLQGGLESIEPKVRGRPKPGGSSRLDLVTCRRIE